MANLELHNIFSFFIEDQGKMLRRSWLSYHGVFQAETPPVNALKAEIAPLPWALG
jgi:hypothetical protein